MEGSKLFNTRLLKLVPNGLKGIIASVLARWVGLGAQILLYFVLGNMIGTALSGGSYFDIASFVLCSAACLITWLVTDVIARRAALSAGTACKSTLTALIFDKIIALGISRNKTLSDSKLAQLAREGVQLLQTYFSSYVPQFFFALLAPLTLFVVIAILDFKIAICLLICVLLVPVSIVLLMKNAKLYMGDCLSDFANICEAFLDALRGMTTLVIYGSDEEKHEQLDIQAEEFRIVTMRLLRVQLNGVTLMDFFTYGGIALGLIITIAQFASGAIDASAAITIALLASAFFMPMRAFGSQFHTGMNASCVIDELFELLDTPVSSNESEQAEAQKLTACEINASCIYSAADELLAEEQDEAEEAPAQMHVTSSSETANDENAHIGGEAQQPTKRSAAATFAKFMALTGSIVPELILASLVGFLGWACVIAVPFFFVSGILVAFGAELFASSELCMILGAACAILRGPLHYAERLLTHDQTFRTLSSIRSEVFGQMRRLAPAKLEGSGSDKLISSLANDVDLIEGFYSRICMPVFSAILVALATTAAIGFTVSPICAGVALCAYLVIGFVLPAISAKITRKPGAELRAHEVATTDFLHDNLADMANSLHFGRSAECAEELNARMDNLTKAEEDFGRTTAILGALPQFFAYASYAIMTALGISLVGAQVIDAATATLCSVAFIASMEAILAASSLGFSLNQTLAAANRILDITEDTPKISETGYHKIYGFQSLEVQDLAFSCKELSNGASTSDALLDNISFTITPGSFVGISDKGGIEKSALLKLLMHFWDVDSGSIKVNGHDVCAIELQSLRAIQSYVTKDTYIFDGTLRYNLLVGKPNATLEELAEAIRKANLQDVINNLPHGIDTLVDKHGCELSNAERQCVGLARAFLKDAPVMFLDEPTSNLDASNEAAILSSLCSNSKGKTVVIASNSKAVAAIVDKLLVLER